jgi:hypothetical protein
MASSRRMLSVRKRAAATTLSEFPGVVGVFWGQRHRAGAWRDERCLAVHVHTKHPRGALPRDHLLPERISGYPVDVVEVGAASVHARALDYTDRAHATPAFSGSGSSVTLVTYREGEGAYALLSGHGVLPVAGGKFQPVPGPSPQHVYVQDETVQVFDGVLLSGTVSSDADYAVARFADLGADEVLVSHGLAGRCPVRFLMGVPSENAVLRHYSVTRRDTRIGRYRGVSASPVRLHCGGVGDLLYDHVLLASTEQSGPFSVPGDSGSLVTDNNCRAVGTIIGGAADRSKSYLLHTTAIAAQLWDSFAWFFRNQG